VLHLTKSQIAEKSSEALEGARVAELEEANAQLRAELNVAESRLAKVVCCEQALASDYEDLKKEFDELRSSQDVVVKEKADLEKTEHEKAQWFRNLLRKKMVVLRRDTEESVAALRG
jgi:DNA mismatch repair ATPase MutL